MSNTFDKLSVLDSFIEEVNSYLPQIDTNLESLTQSPADMDALEETYRFTHTIGGAASMMDFPGLAHVAHGMEDILGDALDGITTLDEATLSLLRRSLSRLHQLLKGVHNGIDEEAVIAEDDEDYARYRAIIEPVLNTQQPYQQDGLARGAYEEYAQVTDPFVMGSIAPSSSSQDTALPSFDEVLASFRTPVVLPDEEVAWPEDPLPTSQLDKISQPSQEIAPSLGSGDKASESLPPLSAPEKFALPVPSALDVLMASTRTVTSSVPAIEAKTVSPIA
jgi:chemotaxis protein histidine kinase CheA